MAGFHSASHIRYRSMCTWRNTFESSKLTFSFITSVEYSLCKEERLTVDVSVCVLFSRWL